MTPEVKQRIEQIRQGIVPEGYKKTKTDIVPADWKESPVGEYIREYTEKTTIPNQYPVLTSARTGLMLQTDYYSNRQVTTEDNVGYNVLPYGYITFRSRSDDGHFRFNENRIIKRGIISYFYPVFSFSEEVCHEYMLYLLNFSIYRRMYPYAEGTAQQVLSLKKLGQLKYSLPPVAEQKKIAEILATQDKAIELQARKIEELKRIKKGCLEKMFPRKGQKVPEKRFPGFTDDWEQRKVGDITIESTEYLTLDSGLPLFTSSRNGLLYQNEYRGNVTTNNKQTLFSVVPLGACTYRHMSDDDVFHLNINTIEKGLVSREYPVFCGTPNHDIVFIVQHINSSKAFRAFCAEQKMGGTRTRLYYKALCEFTMMVPSFAEQRRISKFLLTIDHLITLHQRKLEEMKKQKKALMQLLLTGIVRVKP